MGRPRKQTVEYFPHYVNTESKTRFILEQSWGNDGYAFWFKLLELLGRSEGHTYDCSTVPNMKYLTALVRVDEETACDILDTLAELGDIDRELWEQRKVIWCQSLVDNLQGVYSKRTVEAPVKPSFEGSPVNEKKPARPRRTGTLSAEQQERFDRFYKAYPKKVDRATAERAWGKIKPEPDDEMTEKIVKAVEMSLKCDSRFREKQYIPNPATWLNAKGYENEWTEEGEKGYGNFKPSGGFKGAFSDDTDGGPEMGREDEGGAA